ncbi:hypothetical protein EDD85DRAFT_859581 [Armillaria nabsnona]|nr:hypothetical protein EDD85DRAFT_859581 [Armillaria nabsnona]
MYLSDLSDSTWAYRRYDDNAPGLAVCAGKVTAKPAACLRSCVVLLRAHFVGKDNMLASLPFVLTRMLPVFRNLAARPFKDNLGLSLSERMTTTACHAVRCAQISAVARSATYHFFSLRALAHRSSISHFDQDASFLHHLRFPPTSPILHASRMHVTS